MNTLRKFCFIALAIVLAGCDDGGGGFHENPPNISPAAMILANPISGSVPVTIRFDGSGSRDPDGVIRAWTWDFGDGNAGSGVNASHQYTQSGVYTVRLTVMDNRDGQASTTTLVDLTQPTVGTWLGTYESSLIDESALNAEIEIAGTAISGTYQDNAGRSGTISGSVNVLAVTLQLVSTTPGCPGTFTGTGNIDASLIPGSDAMVFTFSGSDCEGNHSDGAGVLVFQTSTVVAWGLVNPTGLTHRDGHLFWSDRSIKPLKKLETATGNITPLANRMISIFSLTVGTNHIQWTDESSDFGTSGCVGRGVARALMVADADGSNPRELATGDFCGNSMAPDTTMTDGTYAYWVVADSNTPGRIERVPLAAGEPEVLASPGNGFIGMAIDSTHVYWSERSIADYSNIFRCPLTGCDGQTPETILATGDEFTIWNRMILVGDQLVFGSRRTGEPMYEISIMPKDGGTPTLIADSPGQVGQMLSDGNTVFWLSDDILRSVPIGGGAVTVVVPDFFYVQDIALGPDRVYWTDSSCQGGFPDGIYYADKTGGPVSTLVTGDSPYKLAVDVDGNVVYADGGTSGFEPAGIYRVSPAGVVIDALSGLSGPSLLSVDDQNVYAVQGFNIKSVSRDGGNASLVAKTNFYVEAMDSDGSNVYWLEDPLGTVFSAPVDRSTPPISLGFNNEKAFDLKVSGNYAYWLGGGDTLSRAPIDGSGPVETLTDRLGFVEKLIVDDSFIYFNDPDVEFLARMMLTGGVRKWLVTTGPSFGWFAMTQDADNIYWAKAGTLRRIAKAGGNEKIYPAIVKPDQFAEESFAVDDQFIYWTEEIFGAIKRIPK